MDRGQRSYFEAQTITPALAVGNAVVVKPASLDNSGGVGLGGVSLNIGKARPAEVAKDEMHIFIDGWNKRRLGHDAHSLTRWA